MSKSFFREESQDIEDIVGSNMTSWYFGIDWVEKFIHFLQLRRKKVNLFICEIVSQKICVLSKRKLHLKKCWELVGFKFFKFFSIHACILVKMWKKGKLFEILS